MFRKTTILTLLLCLVVAAQTFAAGSKPENSAEKHAELYNEGLALLKEGDLEGAAGKLKAALATKEDFAEAHNNLGYTLRKMGADHFDEALAHYDRALELKPDLAEAYHYRGVLHALAGDEEKAQADHARLLELDRDLAEELLTVIASGEEPAGLAGAAGKW